MMTRIFWTDSSAALKKEFKIDTAIGGAPALAMMRGRSPYGVVVADMQMPVMNGIEFLMELERRAPDTIRIMLTGNADQKTARDAVNQGHIFRFLTKPCPREELAADAARRTQAVSTGDGGTGRAGEDAQRQRPDVERHSGHA